MILHKHGIQHEYCKLLMFKIAVEYDCLETHMSHYIRDGGGGLTLMNNWVIDMQVIMQISP